MFSKERFRRRKDKESREGKDGHNKVSREGSGSTSKASSRANLQRSEVAPKAPEVSNGSYLRTTLKHFACMPGLAEDVGNLLHEARKKLKKLQDIDGVLKGRGPVGSYAHQCTEHLFKAQKTHWSIENSIKNEDRELKKERLVQTEGGVTAYEEAFIYANGCSPETWEITRTMGKNEDDLDLVISRYRQILESKNCKKVKKAIVMELISKSTELKATHVRAQSILEIDNDQEQSGEPRGGARDPPPYSASKVTLHPRRSGSRSS